MPPAKNPKIEPIRLYGEAVLRQKTKKIKDPLAEEIQRLIPLMFASMRAAKGMGLAAPQIGENLRICVIEEAGEEYVLINPTITNFSKDTIVLEEGCLSFPGQFFQIERPEKVKVQYLDQSGKRAKLKASGLLARAIQHELDHLDGILLIDHTESQTK